MAFIGVLALFISLVITLSDSKPKSDAISEADKSENSKNDTAEISNLKVKYAKVPLNVRKSPDEKSEIIRVLKQNEGVYTIDEVKNGFTQILNSSNRNYGWCATEFLQDSPLSESQLNEIELRKIEASEKKANAWKNKDNSIGAWTIVTMAVKESLISPRTAKFPWGGPSEHVTRNGQVYTVKSYVDSQNAFGAMIRTHFIAKVEQTSKDNWTAISFETY
jgi:uncharacterized protein YgiM (DUF1202 family)